MKNLHKKITFVSIIGFLAIFAGSLAIFSLDFGMQKTAARYALTTQASTTFETGSFFFDCDGEAIAYPGQHDGQVMELELDYNRISPSIDIDVKNFVGTKYTTQDISYIVSINDGTNSNHVNYDFSINDAAIGSSDVSQPRTISGDNANTDTISLKFNRTNDNVGGDTINIKIKSLAPYEKEIFFQIRIILPLITVNFDANGGNVSVASTQIRYLSQYSTGTNLGGTLPTPTKSGYYFAGWYEDGSDFDYVQYYQMYTDIYNAFGGDQVKTTAHWIGYGVLEGRDGRRTRVKDNTLHTYSAVHAIHAMWVPLERVVEVYSPTSNNQTVTCTTSDGQTFINSTTRTSHGIVMLSANDMSISYRCIIKADGYLPYDTGMITKTSKNFAYDHAVYTQGITYVSGMTLTPAPFTVSFDANGGTVSPSSKQVTYLSNYGDLPTPTRTHYAFKGWYLNGTQVTSATTNIQTANHTLIAQWESTARTITLQSTAVKTYDGDEQILQCNYVDASKNPGGNAFIYSVQTMTTSGNQSASTTPASAIPYYYDDGDFECSVTADGYVQAYQGSISYGDTSIMSKTITISPTASDIVNAYSNTASNTAATGTLTNTRTGYYLIELWGGKGGNGYTDGSRTGGNGGSAGYMYGVVKLNHGDVLTYKLGGNGTNGKNKSKNMAGGSEGGGYASYDDSFNYAGGSGGAYSKLDKSSNEITTMLMVAGGGAGASGPGGSNGGQKGGNGGNGGMVSSESGSYGSGIAFYGGDGQCGAKGCAGNAYEGRGGTTTGGINAYFNDIDVMQGKAWQGGSSNGRGGAGGAGLFGGAGGYSNASKNYDWIVGHAITTGGGGGSSYLDGSVNYQNLPASPSLTGNNPSSTGGGLRIQYIGKSL